MTTRLVSTPRKSGGRRSEKRLTRQNEGSADGSASPKGPWLALIGLTLLTLALYSQVASHDFINLDDQEYVTENSHVQQGLTWQTLRWAATSTEQANWHPLTWLSHALDCQVFGLSPGGHHITSLVIHLLNVVLLFWLLWRATGLAGRAFLVAALFAAHPLNVESVAWIAERKNVLSTFFFFLSLLAYGWYARKPDWKRYSAVAILFALGLASKPMVVTLPFVLLLLDHWPLGRMSGVTAAGALALPQVPVSRLAKEKLPLLFLSAVSSVVTVLAQKASGAVESLQIIPLSARVEIALHSYFLYVWKMVWPSGLAAFYPTPFDPAYGADRGSDMLGIAILSGLFLAGISFLTWKLRVRKPYLLVGWLWYLGTLVPVIGIVQVGKQSMADRYAYIPVVGLFVALVWALADLAEHWELGSAVRQAVSAAILIALGVVTVRQAGFWQDTFAIWSHTIAATNDNFVADDLMASALMAQKNPQALRYYQHAASVAPMDGISHGFVAASLQDQGRLREAIPEYEIVAKNPPDVKRQSFAYLNLGIIYSELGNYTKANLAFERVRSKDQDALGEMIENLSQAVANHPATEGYVRLGVLMQHAGRLIDARGAFEQALSLNPGRADAQALLNQTNQP